MLAISCFSQLIGCDIMSGLQCQSSSNIAVSYPGDLRDEFCSVYFEDKVLDVH